MSVLYFLVPTLLYAGWGIFGYVMWRLDSFYFHDFPAPMIALMTLMGAITGLGVMSVAKLLGLS